MFLPTAFQAPRLFFVSFIYLNILHVGNSSCHPKMYHKQTRNNDRIPRHLYTKTCETQICDKHDHKHNSTPNPLVDTNAATTTSDKNA